MKLSVLIRSLCLLVASFRGSHEALASPAAALPWWKTGVIYQIYPRSYQDTDSDGIGDLKGILNRLDYLKGLGVDAIWISPFYPSPLKDFGYDISDFKGIDPTFGTLSDFDNLLQSAHEKGLKVLLDFVPNHTSDQHPWFQESRKSKENAKRDWYIWRNPSPGGGPPNHWLSVFGGSAWELDKSTGQYYYHAFLPEQPDLNWRNPEVRSAMYEAMRFWLDKGVDGFRVDAVAHLVEDEKLTENPINPNYRPKDSEYDRQIPIHTADLEATHEIVAEMRKQLDAYPNRVLITEAYLPFKKQVVYYGKNGTGANLPFNFHLINTEWKAQAIRKLTLDYEKALPPGAWPNWVLGNHDKSRVASRVGEAQARNAAMLLLTSRGTPTLYYGDEIGMMDVPVSLDEIHDPVEKREPGKGLGRDPERSPMQWDSTANAGFTIGKPWLPVGPDFKRRNVVTESSDPKSLLSLYRKLLSLRRAESAFSAGDYVPEKSSSEILVFGRRFGGRSFLVALNFSHSPAPLPLRLPSGTLVLSTLLDREGLSAAGLKELRPDEGVIVRVESGPR